MTSSHSKVGVKDYLSLARVDHWVKNLFLFPGLALALAYIRSNPREFTISEIFARLLLSIVSLCLASSANYTINEWLDRSYDKFHSEKQFRPSVSKALDFRIVWAQYLTLVVTSLIVANLISIPVFLLVFSLLLMGVLYNVQPIRLKDRFYFDVISESVNNPIRVGIGWYVAIDSRLFPASAFIAFWAAGIFLMGLKRFTEMNTIQDGESLKLYRKSFNRWTTKKLLCFTLSGAVTTTAFLGILLAGYKIEYIFLLPSIVFLFQYYFGLALESSPEVTAPEDLWRNNHLNLQVSLLIVFFILLSFIEIPILRDLVGFKV